ncbi:hypothetical protein T484DRAFT_1798934, partial [Baffinella frigidus]
MPEKEEEEEEEEVGEVMAVESGAGDAEELGAARRGRGRGGGVDTAALKQMLQGVDGGSTATSSATLPSPPLRGAAKKEGASSVAAGAPVQPASRAVPAPAAGKEAFPATPAKSTSTLVTTSDPPQRAAARGGGEAAKLTAEEAVAKVQLEQGIVPQ